MSLHPKAVSAELLCLLGKYIRLDTTNPPGNEQLGARFLKRVLARDGIDSEVIETAPGRANLVARLKGRESGKALMLMHHMDVVPASSAEWTVPPMEATVQEGQIWGRGAFDNKGPGIVQFLSVVLLKRLGVQLQHDVVLLAVADEESGGTLGARWLTAKRPDLFDDVEFVLNEGGGILVEGARWVYVVELAQKAPLWLKVTARGPSGHGSTPRPNAAAAVLVRALARLSEYRFEPVVLPEVQAMFTERAAAMPEPARSRHQHCRSR